MRVEPDDEPSMDTFERLLNPLRILAPILEKYEYDWHAAHLRHLIALGEARAATFTQELGGLSLWGGSGAVWEIGTLRLEGISKAEARRDERQFGRAIIELADEMTARQLGTEMGADRPRFIASAFRSRTRVRKP
jgi:hypothetical protein